uniref:Uncharacterized protein n=1 Tax=Rhodnius prolixus TaxID=13249 RepID=T1IDG1_RHOPR
MRFQALGVPKFDLVVQYLVKQNVFKKFVKFRLAGGRLLLCPSDLQQIYPSKKLNALFQT